MKNPITLLTPSKQEELQRFTEGLSHEQLLWASGYMTGLGINTKKAIASNTKNRVTILFGTETGNATRLANILAEKVEAMGFQSDVQDMLTYNRARLRQDRTLLVIVSTHGDGDPPDNACVLHTLLTKQKVRDLSSSSFAVLALGDASYPQFCQTGKDFDEALAASGAKRLLPRVDCDVDYEQTAEQWMDKVLFILSDDKPLLPELPEASTSQVLWSSHAPFPAVVLDKVKLSGRGSTREVWHLELDLEGSDICYEAGDIASVIPTNPPRVVEELFDRLELDNNTVIVKKNNKMPLREALSSHYEITRLTKPFLERYAKLSEAKELQNLLAKHDVKDLSKWIDGREISDIVGQYPIKGLDAQSFVDCLRSLPPRRYSIASSFLAYPDELHLTVAAVRYLSHGRERVGVASTFMIDHVATGHPVPICIESNTKFHLPQDPTQAIIMISAGTGIAPFRSFLQERELLGSTGKNWLFFGDRRFRTDFLYQREWLRWLENGHLNRLDVSFSRDQQYKIYVQDRLLENAKEIYSWLEDNAVIYVCGGEEMAQAVELALGEIIRSAGGRTTQQVEEYILKLKQAGSYKRDVY